MPLYEYQCEACGHRFERIQRFSDPPLDRCPKCGGAVHKLQSAPAFQFKGSGWYITDYAKKEQAPAEKSDGPKKAGGDAAEGGDKKETAKTEKSAEKSSSGTSSTSPAPASPAKDSKST
jgi:putative FmdB family regulatory protein